MIIVQFDPAGPVGGLQVQPGELAPAFQVVRAGTVSLTTTLGAIRLPVLVTPTV